MVLLCRNDRLRRHLRHDDRSGGGQIRQFQSERPSDRLGLRYRHHYPHGADLRIGRASSQTGADSFKYAYGVDFSTAAGSNNKITMFIDNYPISAPNGIYDSGDSSVSTYTVTRGAVVSAICVSNSDGNDCLSSGVPVGNANQLDITFQRPNPDAVICANGSCGTKYPFAAIFIKGTDGSTREVIVRDTGQISVQE